MKTFEKKKHIKKRKEIDMITLHLINNFLYSVVDEMTAPLSELPFHP